MKMQKKNCIAIIYSQSTRCKDIERQSAILFLFKWRTRVRSGRAEPQNWELAKPHLTLRAKKKFKQNIHFVTPPIQALDPTNTGLSFALHYMLNSLHKSSPSRRHGTSWYPSAAIVCSLQLRPADILSLLLILIFVLLISQLPYT